MRRSAAQEAIAGARPKKGRAKVAEPTLFPLDVSKPGPGFDDALAAMRDPAYLRSRNWQEKQWVADREGVHPHLLEFERLLVKRMGRLGVPMHCVLAVSMAGDEALGDSPYLVGCAVAVVHAVRAWNLSSKQWALVGHVGEELAKQRGLHVLWGGQADPARWEVDGWRYVASGFPFPVLRG
jgi:hypothetical protein